MKPSTPKLSEVARHLVLPDGIVSTGWPAVRDTCRNLGVNFDLWQQGAASAALGKGEDGLYAADAVVMSIPRQVGKTFMVGWIIFALCLIRPGLTVIWTAHRYKTASETYETMRAMARKPLMRAHIDKVPQGAGNQAVIFRNGSRILFGARERGFGRGFTEVDALIFDEAQILTDGAIDDMVPATNHSKNPLIFYIGTPPKPTDPGEVFTRLRAEALSGESTDTFFVELSADQGADPMDRAQWGRANPSYLTGRVGDRAMLRMKKNLTPEAFLREALGIWGIGGLAAARPIAADDWQATSVPESDAVPDGRRAFVLDVAPGMRSAAVGVAVGGGRPHGEMADAGSGTEWVRARLVELYARHPDAVFAVDSTGAAPALVPELAAAGVPVVLLTARDMQAGCAHLQKLSLARGFTHTADPVLDAAFGAAVKRDVGDGAWDWGRRKASGDISPLRALTGALWVVERERAEGTPEQLESFY